MYMHAIMVTCHVFIYYDKHSWNLFGSDNNACVSNRCNVNRDACVSNRCHPQTIFVSLADETAINCFASRASNLLADRPRTKLANDKPKINASKRSDGRHSVNTLNY